MKKLRQKLRKVTGSGSAATASTPGSGPAADAASARRLSSSTVSAADLPAADGSPTDPHADALEELIEVEWLPDEEPGKTLLPLFSETSFDAEADKSPFYDAFVESFRDWHPAPDDLQAGHPTSVVVGVASHLRELIMPASDSFQFLSDPALSPGARDRAVQLLRVLAIVCRAQRNRIILFRRHALQFPATLQALSLQIIKIFARDDEIRARDAASNTSQSRRVGSELPVFVVPFLEVLEALVDVSSYDPVWDRLQSADVSRLNEDAAPPSHCRAFCTSIVEFSNVESLLDLAFHLNSSRYPEDSETVQARLSPLQRTLRVVQTLLHQASVSLKQPVVDADGINLCLRLLGWHCTPKDNAECLRLFDCGLRSMHLVFQLVSGTRLIGKFVDTPALGGLMAFLLWAHQAFANRRDYETPETSPTFAAFDDAQATSSPPSFDSMSHLFMQTSQSTHVETSTRSVAKGIQIKTTTKTTTKATLNSEVPVPPITRAKGWAEPSPLARCLSLNLFFALAEVNASDGPARFTGMVTRILCDTLTHWGGHPILDPMIQDARLDCRARPGLQHLVLDFLGEVIKIAPTRCIESLRVLDLWEPLFSGAFYLSGYTVQDTVTGAPGPALPAISGFAPSSDPYWAHLQLGLRYRVLKLLEDSIELMRSKVVSVDALVPAVNALADTMAAYPDVSDIVYEGARCLRSAFARSLAEDDHLIQVVRASRAFPSLMTVCRNQYAWVKAGGIADILPEVTPGSRRKHKAPAASADKTVTLLFHMARYETLACVDHIIRRERVRIIDLGHHAMHLGPFFELVLDPLLKDFVWDHVCKILSVAAQVPPRDPTKPADPPQEIDSARLAVFNKFCELFGTICRTVQDPSGLAEFAYPLLDKLVEVLPLNLETNQNAFREAGAFIQLANILNIQEAPDLCRKVLETWRPLLSDNLDNMVYLRTHIGYQQLYDLILRADRGSPTVTIYQTLLDMLVDGAFDMDYRFIVRNPDVMKLIIRLLPNSTDEVQVQILDTIIALADKCTRNRNQCCGVGILHDLLERLAQLPQDGPIYSRTLQIIKLLGSHSISVKELKLCFSLLKSEKGDRRPRDNPILVKSMANMAWQYGPKMFYDFDGLESHMVLPTINQWPDSSGYSFVTWLRVESFVDPRQSLPVAEPTSGEYLPRLFSFLTEQGKGVEAYFRDGSLRLSVSGGKGGRQEVHLKFPFTERTWYLLGITHSCSKVPWAPNEIKLYMNGYLACRDYVKYPSVGEPLTHCRIGGNAALPRLGDPLLARESPLCGQLGSVFVFDEVLGLSHFQALHKLGADYTSTFVPTDFDSVPKPIRAVVDGSLHGRLFLSYNCKAVVSAQSLDNAPTREKNGKIIAGGRHAALRGMNHCVTRPIKDMLHCLGGIKVLFPLFAQLDQPVRSEDAGAAPDYSVDKSWLVHVLGLLRSMLQNSSANQEDMMRCHGFQAVGFVMRRFSPLHLSKEAVRVLLEISHICHDSELLTQLLQHVLLAPQVWEFAGMETIDEWLNVITSMIATQPTFFKEVAYPGTAGPGGVVRFLDMLSSPFGFPLEPRERKHAVTGEVVGRSVDSLDALISIRARILDVIRLMLGKAPTARDVQTILLHILWTKVGRGIRDVLQLLLEIFNDHPSVVCEGVALAGGLDPLLGLLTTDDEDVRVLSLRAIGLLIDFDAVYPEGSAFRKNRGSLGVVARQLAMFPFSERTYCSLLAIMLANTTIDGSESVDMDDQKVIRRPGALSAIFKLLPGSSVELQERALQDLTLLVSNLSANRDSVLKLFGWQSWLFALMAECPKGGVVFDLCVHFIRVVVAHAMLHTKEGGPVLLTTLHMLCLFSHRGGLNARQLAGVLLTEISGAIYAHLQQAFEDKPVPYSTLSKKLPHLVDNLMHMLCVADEYIYHDALFPSAGSGPPHSSMLGGGASGGGGAAPAAQSLGAALTTPPAFVGGAGSTVSSASSSELPPPVSPRSAAAARERAAMQPLDPVALQGATPQQLWARFLAHEYLYCSHHELNRVRDDGSGSSRSAASTAADEARRGSSTTLRLAQPDLGHGPLAWCDLRLALALIDLFDSLDWGQTLQSKSKYGGNKCWGLRTLFALVRLSMTALQEAPDDFILRAWDLAGAAVGDRAVVDKFTRLPRRLVEEFSSPNATVVGKEVYDDRVITYVTASLLKAMQVVLAGASARDPEDKARGKASAAAAAGIYQTLLSAMVGHSTILAQHLTDGAQASLIEEGGSPKAVSGTTPLHEFAQLVVDKDWQDAIARLAASTFTRPADDDEMGSITGVASLDTATTVASPTAASETSSTGGIAIPGASPTPSSSGAGAAAGASGTLSSSPTTLASSPRGFRTSISGSLRAFTMSTAAMAGARDPHQQLRERMEKADEAEMALERRFDGAFEEVMQRVGDTEGSRRGAVSKEAVHWMRVATARWQETVRSLTSERGPWSASEKPEAHWKLDKTEDKIRRRRRLKFNYHFDQYQDCAFRPDVEQARVDSERGSEGGDKDRSSVSLAAGVKINKDDVLPEENLPPETPADEKSVFTTECEHVTPMGAHAGILEITTSHMYYYAQRGAGEAEPSEWEGSNVLLKDNLPHLLRDRKWPLESIREIHVRRYLLRRSALEIFLDDRTNVFFNFPKNDRMKVFQKLSSSKVVNLAYSNSHSGAELLKKSDVTARWQRHEISNFEYLMVLNTMAGRTFNDLTQYPVFPWVLCDYKSETIDLADPAVYRDLSKPIGALDEDRLEHFVDRYRTFEDPMIPKFHYGSHYSSAGIVLQYLIRMEPFTRLFLELQGGKFDHADRMFSSIPASWDSVLHATSDVKELTPEFYYQPEFLVNSNNFDLGTTQNGERLNNVALPAWAKDPHDFVRIHREALESEHVSAHLHEWIDLIFGEKQRGDAAAEAHNVFYYLTYEGAVDIDSIEDPQLRKAYVSQIANFGQTPSQILTKAHPKRFPRPPSYALVRQPDLVRGAKTPEAVAGPGEQQYRVRGLRVSDSALVHVSVRSVVKTLPSRTQASASASAAGGVFSMSSNGPCLYCRVVTVDANQTVASCRIQYMLETGKVLVDESTLEKSGRKKFGVFFEPSLSPGPMCFDSTSDGRILFSCGFWDETVKCTQVESGKLVRSVRGHKNTVTCVALGEDNRTLATGSMDNTVHVREMSATSSGALKVNDQAKHVLYGHDDRIISLAVDTDLDIVVSCSMDGSAIVHMLQPGRYLRSFYHPTRAPFHHVCVADGHIVLYSLSDLVLRVYTVNGEALGQVDTMERLVAVKRSKDGAVLVTAGEKGVVVFRRRHDLAVIHKQSVDRPVVSLDLCDEMVVAGTDDGQLKFLTCVSAGGGDEGGEVEVGEVGK